MSQDEQGCPDWGPEQMSRLRASLTPAQKVWDLVVVGGGITGAGVARDAAMRGLDVLVIEANDIAYGTSSRSSRLIHGGVRYLEQLQVGLVYEALRERARLYACAPHLVLPKRFLFPAYRGDRLGPWLLRIGLTLYDTLNAHRGDPHDFLAPEQCAKVEPLLASENLRGAVQYEDAVTDDARLTLAVLQDARRHGAEVLTYTPVETIGGDPREKRIDLADGGTVRSRAVVVATGPWTGQRLLGTAGDNLLSLSKGIHIVMRHEDVPVHQPVVVQAQQQRRILFVVPWGTRTYLGTTDAPYTGDPGHSGVTEQDEQELLDLVGRLLPTAALRPDRIVSAWSGVRPLVRDPGSKGEDTVELSRRHRVVETSLGVLGIVGGKLTTFRAMAEETVDRVVKQLTTMDPERTAPRPCQTHEIPLVPGEPLRPEELADPIIADLASRHGPHSRSLVARIAKDPVSAARLVNDLPYRWCEVDEAIEAEGATRLTDILRRRIPLALTDPDLGGEVARPIAVRLVDAAGADGRQIDRELDLYREEVERETRRTVRVLPS